MGQEDYPPKDELAKKLQKIEAKVDILDQKVVFLFKKVNNINERISAIVRSGITERQAIEASQPIPSTPMEIPQKDVSPKQETVRIPTVSQEEVSVNEPLLAAAVERQIAAQLKQISPVTTASAVQRTPEIVPTSIAEPVKPRKPAREPFNLIAFFKNEENLPFFLLIAFYALLAALVFGVIYTIKDIPVIQQNAFLIIGSSACVFTVAGFVWKLALDRKIKLQPEKEKKLKNYFLFPWSFQAIGTAGVLIAYLVSLNLESSLSPQILFPIAIGISLIAFAMSVLYKNELLILESSLSIVILLLMPVISEVPIYTSPYSGYLYFGFFAGFVLIAVLLSAFNLTLAPLLISLISYSIFAFTPNVYNALELDTFLVILPACAVAILMRLNAFDRYKFYNNKIMKTVILFVDIVLPLGSYCYLMFVQDAAIPSWEILASTTVLVTSYFLTMKQVMTTRMEEYDNSNPVAVEILSVFMINTPIFLSLLAEITRTLEAQTYLFLGIYLVFQIMYSILTMTIRVDKESKTFADSIITLLFAEGMFVLLFLSKVASSVLFTVHYEILMSVSLGFLFLAPLVNLIAMRKQKHAINSSFSIILMGGLNYVLFNVIQRASSSVTFTIAPTIAKFVIIAVSIGIGVLSLLENFGKMQFGPRDSQSKITSTHTHALSILCLTISLWVFDVNLILNYIIIGGIFLSVGLWIAVSLLRRTSDKHVTEDLLGYLAVSLVFITVNQASSLDPVLITITSILAVVALAIIPLCSKKYNVLFPLLLYIPQWVALATTTVNPIYGAGWMIAVAFLVPTISVMIKSINNEYWYNRVGTVVLVAAMLVLSTISLNLYVNYSYSVFVIVNCYVLMIFPIALFIVNLWFNKKQSPLNVLIEFPIDLTVITIGTLIASAFIPLAAIAFLEELLFGILLIGTVVGPLLYGITRFVYKDSRITHETYRFISAGFILAIQILISATGGFALVGTVYYIILLLCTVVSGVLIQIREKLDSLTILPSLVSMMILPMFNGFFNPVVSPWFTFSIFVVNLIVLSIGWFGSRYDWVSFAGFFVACLAIVISLFDVSVSFFTGLPVYFPTFLFTAWMIGIILSIVITKRIPKGNMGDALVWLFAITLTIIAFMKVDEVPYSAPNLLNRIILLDVSLIPAILVFIIFSAYLQYKTKDTAGGLISHISAIQAVLIVIGFMMFQMGLHYPDVTTEVVTYILFNIFGVIAYVVLQSLVLENTVIRSENKNIEEVIYSVLFLPIFIFSLLISIRGDYLGIIPIVLGIVFYGMSQRHNMQFSSVLAALSIAVSAFFITTTEKLLSWTGFGIISAIMVAMMTVGIILYVKTQKKFHILTNVLIGLISEVIIGLLLPTSGVSVPFPWPLKLGFSFNLALGGLLIGVIFGIREFRRIFTISSGVLIIPYLVVTFIQIDEAGLLALLFLGTGIIFILASYLVYNRLKEKQKQEATTTTGE